MDKSRVEGNARQAAGAVKSAAERVPGDAATEAEGLADRAAGAAKEAYAHVKEAASEGADQVAKEARRGAGKVAGFVRSNPVSSVLAVGAVFFGLGFFMGGLSGGGSSG
ncbi:MAG: CsbD family protein [Hyphomicrobiales bacterium]